MTGYERRVWLFLLDFVGNPPPNASPTAFFLEAPHEAPRTPSFSTPLIEA